MSDRGPSDRGEGMTAQATRNGWNTNDCKRGPKVPPLPDGFVGPLVGLDHLLDKLSG